MGKSLKAAIVAQALVLAMAILFLLAFLGLGVGRDHALLNISLVLAAVVGTALLLVILWRRTLLREALIRRFYVSPSWIYNHEIGYAPLARIAPDGNVFAFVIYAADALARMSYGFDVAETPTTFEPRLVIDSRIFLFHESGEDGGIVIDDWHGVLRQVDDITRGERGLSDIAAFDDAGELALLLERHEAFSTVARKGGVA